MSLVILENGQLKLADSEPLTRSKLLSHASFCAKVADVMSYIESLRWERSNKFFRHEQVSNQFNMLVQETTESDAPFSIDSWYSNAKGSSDEPDWMSILIEEELRTEGSFVSQLKNCIDMEDRLTSGNFQRMRAFVASGNFGKNGSSSGDLNFFGAGGISAPLRFRGD